MLAGHFFIYTQVDHVCVHHVPTCSFSELLLVHRLFHSSVFVIVVTGPVLQPSFFRERREAGQDTYSEPPLPLVRGVGEPSYLNWATHLWQRHCPSVFFVSPLSAFSLRWLIYIQHLDYHLNGVFENRFCWLAIGLQLYQVSYSFTTAHGYFNHKHKSRITK